MPAFFSNTTRRSAAQANKETNVTDLKANVRTVETPKIVSYTLGNLDYRFTPTQFMAEQFSEARVANLFNKGELLHIEETSGSGLQVLLARADQPERKPIPMGFINAYGKDDVQFEDVETVITAVIEHGAHVEQSAEDIAAELLD